MSAPVDIYAPLEQAARCLDIWLKEEQRTLPPAHKRRAVALLARYFLYEDDVPDQLMLSFLRHYSGRGEVDMDDPASVRSEIKTLLDKSAPIASVFSLRHMDRVMMAGVICLLLAFLSRDLARMKLTDTQKSELKSMVSTIVTTGKAPSTAAVWADVKAAFDVRRYQDISRWDYKAARRILEEKAGVN